MHKLKVQGCKRKLPVAKNYRHLSYKTKEHFVNQEKVKLKYPLVHVFSKKEDHITLIMSD